MLAKPWFWEIFSFQEQKNCFFIIENTSGFFIFMILSALVQLDLLKKTGYFFAVQMLLALSSTKLLILVSIPDGGTLTVSLVSFSFSLLAVIVGFPLKLVTKKCA